MPKGRVAIASLPFNPGAPYFIPCFSCEHYTKDGKCAAFPKGIPTHILKGLYAHVKPVEGQVGDYVFKTRR